MSVYGFNSESGKWFVNGVWVGEHGPEMVNLPPGTHVIAAEIDNTESDEEDPTG